MKRDLFLAAFAAVMTAGVAIPAFADTKTCGFESFEGYTFPRPPIGSYAANSVHDLPFGPGLNSWFVAPNSTPYPNFDQEITVVDFHTGAKSLRYSNSHSNGVIQQLQTPKLTEPAGEPGTFAENGGVPVAIGKNVFTEDFWIKSGNPTVERGSRITISADDGVGARMNWLALQPTTGATPSLEFVFDDYLPFSFTGGFAGFGDGDFFDHVLMTATPNTWYHVKMVTTFLPGRANDVCKVYIGTAAYLTESDLKYTGTTWEEYYRQGGELPVQDTKAVDCILFRSGVTPQGWDGAAPLTVNGMYLDDFEYRSSAGHLGLPVDLNGGYFAPSSDNVWAATKAFGGDLQVRESSATVAAQEATYTPFSDALKPPALLQGNILDRGFQCDLNLSGTWNGADVFKVSARGSGGTGQVNVSKPGAGYQFDLVNGGTYADATGATSFRLVVSVDAGGNVSAQVETINGSAPGTFGSLGTSSTVLGVAGDTAFRCDFTGGASSKARAAVSGFETDMKDNALFLFADDPYVKLLEPINYRLGMSNLDQVMQGFQAFIASDNANQTSPSGAYTAYPFPQWILTPIFPNGNLAAGVNGGDPAVNVNATLANLALATNGVESRTGIFFRPNSGAPSFAPNRFSGLTGNSVAPYLQRSNLIVVDSTAPSLTSLDANQGGPNLLPGGTTIIGALNLSVNAADVGIGSGLATQPTVTIDFQPAGAGPEDVTIPMAAGPGNLFTASTNITATTPCGVATVTFSVADDAGNLATASSTLNVNPATVTLTITDLNLNITTGAGSQSVTRWVKIKLGSTGGGINAPIVVNKLVTFTDADGNGAGFAAPTTFTLTALDVPTLPCDPGSNLNEVSVKDPVHTLQKKVALVKVGNQYSASVTIRGGDSNNDNLIDILDFGLFAFQYGTSPLGNPSNTVINDVRQSAEYSGNANVGTSDYTFIGTGFLNIGDSDPGNYTDGGGDPLATCTVRQMVKAGVPQKIAQAYDLNKDGWITTEEIQKWLNGGGRRG